jgi:hypothetical protein
MKKQQQPLFIPGPEVPRREDLSSEQDGIDDDDDDEGLKVKSFSTVEKLIPKPQPSLKSFTQSSKINTDNRVDEDEDGGMSKRKESTRKKNLKKRKKGSSKSNIPQEEDNDDGRSDSPYDTIKTVIQFKQPILDSRKAKDESSSDNTNDGDIQSLKQPKGRALTSVDTLDRKALQIFDNIRNTKLKKTTDKNHYDTVLMEDERATQTSTFYSPPSYNLATNPNDVYPLETSSHCEAQQSTPPPIPHRSYIPSVQRNQNNTNDGSSHYSEITIATTRSSVSNRSYSKGVLKEASSNHSNKQQMPEEKKQDDDTNVETEEEEKEEKAHLLKSQPTSSPILQIATSTKDAPKTEEQIECARIIKRKQLRFRWHFLYTILNNYHLLDLRKNGYSRLTCLHLQRSNLVDEQQFVATTVVEVPTTAEYAAGSEMFTPQEGLVYFIFTYYISG